VEDDDDLDGVVADSGEVKYDVGECDSSDCEMGENIMWYMIKPTETREERVRSVEGEDEESITAG
jgi:hypothetical protein